MSPKRLFLWVVLIVIAILVCVVLFSAYFSVNKLSQSEKFYALDGSFNYQTTKLTTIPYLYPAGGGSCEEIQTFTDITCWITAFESNSITFSNSGKSVAYKLLTRSGGKIIKEQVVINDQLGHITLNNPSSAYSVNYNGKIIFSPDSTKIIYEAVKNLEKPLIINSNYTISNKLALVMNGIENAPQEFVSLPEFSPDGQRMAYVIRDNAKYYAVVDDKTYGPYDEISPLDAGKDLDTYFAFSNDNQHFAYQYIASEISGVGATYATHSSYLVINGVSEAKHREIRNLRFAKDGSVMYTAKDITSNGAITETTVGNPNILPVNIPISNYQSSGKYDQTWTPVLSPDGRYIGYGARKGHELWWVVEKLQQ